MAEIRLVEVVDVGPGWNKVRASDGNIYMLDGDYNWRSNNPGNIEYGDFARSHGAIGSGAVPQGRKRGFAIFPTKEAGEQARIALQFESPSYRDKTIAQAIARYAPSFENNTGQYVRIVSDAAGVSPNTRMRDLTDAQRRRFLDAQERFEGFRTGTISRADGKPVPRRVVAQFNGTPLPPSDVPETQVADAGQGDALAAINEATGLPFPSLDNLNAYFEQPGPVQSLLAPVPAPASDRPKSILAPVPAPRIDRPAPRSLLDENRVPGNTTAFSERARVPEPLPLDVLLSGAPNATTSRMDDSGQVLNPWFTDYPPTQALRPDIPGGAMAGQERGAWNEPDTRFAGDIDLGLTERNALTPYIHETGPIARYVIDGATNYAPGAEPVNVYGSSNAGTERSRWNIPNVVPDVPGNSFAGLERGTWNEPTNLEALLGSANTSFAGQDRAPARSDAPQPATMSASLAESRQPPFPATPSRSLTSSRSAPRPATQSDWLAAQRTPDPAPQPATPSASLNRARNRPTPATQSAALAASRTPPVPATQSAALAASRAPQPPVPAMRQSMMSSLNATRLPDLPPPMEQGDGQPPPPGSYDAPFASWNDMTQDAATATGLADFIAGQSAANATGGSFSDMMGIEEPRLGPTPALPPASMGNMQTDVNTIGALAPGSTPMPMPPKAPELTAGIPFSPFVDQSIWGEAPTLPPAITPAPVAPAVATELAVTPPPPPAVFPAPRPTIAPISASMVDTELNPLKRLFSAVTDDRNNRPPVGTILGTADNGGIVTQGHNGLLNSITQESDAWRRVTDPMYGVGKRKAGKRSSGGSLVGGK